MLFNTTNCREWLSEALLIVRMVSPKGAEVIEGAEGDESSEGAGARVRGGALDVPTPNEQSPPQQFHSARAFVVCRTT